MNNQLLWQPQKIHADILTRVAVLSTSLTWYPTSFTGIWFGCFESDDEVQEHPITMLTRFDPGGFFPLHGHAGGEEILVLKGNFEDETGIHIEGTYMLNPEGFIHRPYSQKGCMTFVKLRQHGGDTREQIRTNIFAGQWLATSNPQITIQPIYEQSGYQEKVWFERWEPGTKLVNVVETDIKEIFVVKGTWSDELGSYPEGTWLRYPPDCPYTPFSQTGCLVYVKTYPAHGSPRFVVGKDFRQPWEM